MGIKKFKEYLDVIRSVFGNEVYITQLAIFLEVANHEGISTPDLEKRLGVAQNTLSRNIKKLSRYRDRKTKKIEGLNLMYSTQDLEERRRFVLFLTPEGHELKKRLNSLRKG